MTNTPLALGNGNHAGYSNTQNGIAATLTIQNYAPMLPKRLWNPVADFTRSAVTDFAPLNGREASKVMGHLARLAIWTIDVACQPLQRDIVFNGRHIEAFISNGSIGLTEYGNRCRRSLLLRVASELANFDPLRRDSGKKPHTDSFAPYTAAEIVRFRSQGSTRSTALRRHNWTVLLSLAAGCALTTSEIVGLKVENVSISRDSVRVAIRGDRARTVVCLEAWEADIRELLSSPLVSDYLFVKAERPKIPPMYVTNFLRTVAHGGEQFTVERLRSTWMLGHLEAGTAPVAVMQMVGVKSFSTFERLIPYVTAPSPAAHTAMFRRAAHS
ncbi:tyrosine-type recombinase/integrase [Cryobacterium roopkundense]|uniref:Integrase n=2 Tax=Cryobacterium roopkundense TaxID=1001240 RepID=A0A7W9E5D0_9MICO|nr:tyrosine-type recombinase/integrase [Cryobacterium roopkundense]MBB5643056.1 integrase [Cryobacterium roopkundense]